MPRLSPYNYCRSLFYRPSSLRLFPQHRSPLPSSLIHTQSRQEEPLALPLQAISSSVPYKETALGFFTPQLLGSNVQPFAPTVNLPASAWSSEHAVAGSLGLGGFPGRDIYAAAGK